MSILNPISSANLFVQTQPNPAATSEEQQIGLRLEQMVRATVVEGGLDRALLEMNQRQYRAQSAIELQVGQKLTLQVLQTHPQLELRVINDPLGGRLSQLLPLLTQSYDWSRLLDLLQQNPQQQNLPQSTNQVYKQLQQLLQPDGRLPAALENGLGKLPVQLQQLFLAVANGQRGAESVPRAPQGQQAYVYYKADNSVSMQSLPQLVSGLQGQLSRLQVADGRPLPQVWVTETRQLLAPLPQSLPHLQLQLPQFNDLFAVLGQMRQQPSLPPQFTGELERLILQMNVQSGRELAAAGRTHGQAPAGQPAALPVITTTSGSAVQQGAQGSQAVPPTSSQQGQSTQAQQVSPAPAAVPQPQSAPVFPTEISAGLETLLAEVRQAQGQTGKLSPELFGRLEGLLDKLQQLPQLAQATQPILPGLEMITSQLTQLVQQGPQQPEGGQLGLLSQLFGFHLEAELLKGKKKEALASLKMSLLSMQKELGVEGEEPLRRLEMFQLCKARLAEEQVQFLPLPFNELEEGYLLMENLQEQDDDEAAEQPVQLSLSLRLSALGNMRVDMLYDKQGLHLRMACEDKEKMTYLQDHTVELEESIETVPLQGVSFSADAQVPAVQLLERLLPEARGMLDDRI